MEKRCKQKKKQTLFVPQKKRFVEVSHKADCTNAWNQHMQQILGNFTVEHLITVKFCVSDCLGELFVWKRLLMSGFFIFFRKQSNSGVKHTHVPLFSRNHICCSCKVIWIEIFKRHADIEITPQPERSEVVSAGHTKPQAKQHKSGAGMSSMQYRFSVC